jgi:hypothetical protein
MCFFKLLIVVIKCLILLKKCNNVIIYIFVIILGKYLIKNLKTIYF